LFAGSRPMSSIRLSSSPREIVGPAIDGDFVGPPGKAAAAWAGVFPDRAPVGVVDRLDQRNQAGRALSWATGFQPSVRRDGERPGQLIFTWCAYDQHPSGRSRQPRPDR
jgi:hypothetical protein